MPEHHISQTTLNAIRAHSPCKPSWEKLLAGLGKTKADDEPLPLLQILDILNLDDVLLVLQITKCDDRLSRHFGAWCAEQVLHLFETAMPGDMRPRQAIECTRNDIATQEDRAAAWDDARAATRADAWADAWEKQEAHLRKMLTEGF